jgi:hypothetical protein
MIFMGGAARAEVKEVVDASMRWHDGGVLMVKRAPGAKVFWFFFSKKNFFLTSLTGRWRASGLPRRCAARNDGGH